MGEPPPSEDACFEDLIVLLRAGGHAAAADRLDTLLHKMAWTTGSELLGELGLALDAFEQTGPALAPEARAALQRCRRFIRRARPGCLPWF